MSIPPPPWLATFQAAFGRALSTPLQFHQGTVLNDTRGYAPQLAAQIRPRGSSPARERLAIYNRQYWFRLFTVVQQEFPLLSAVLGPYTVNRLSARFLQAHPPTSPLLGQIADGFASFVLLHAKPGPRLQQAELADVIAVDSAFRKVLAAPPQPPFTPPAALPLAQLSRLRLRPAATMARVSEDRPWLALREQIRRQPPDHALPPPAPHPQGRRHWIVRLGRQGVQLVPLSVVEAELFDLLCQHTIAEAVARLERLYDRRREPLHADTVHSCLRRGTELSLFCGFDDLEQS